MRVGGASDSVAIKLAKAAEYLLMAEFALEGECFDAATSLAVSCAINSGDALCLAQIGAPSSSQDHNAAAKLLRKHGYDQASSLLGRLMGVKNKAQYSTMRCTRTDAETAVKRAERMLTTTRAIVNVTEGQ